MADEKTTLDELFLEITEMNQVARDTKMQEAHQACRLAIKEIIKREHGSISATFEAMFEAGTNIGCDACVDVFKYAFALYNGRVEDIKAIEKKYSTYVNGCAHCPG